MNLDVFGHIEYVVNRKAQNLKIRILPEGLRITIPMASHKASALRFIEQNKEQIFFKQNKLKARNEKIKLEYDKTIQTFSFSILISEADCDQIYFRKKGELLKIECPRNYNLNEIENSKTIWKGIAYFLRLEAKKILTEKTVYYASKFGFTIKDIKIQSSKSRWGSCSAEKNINLSLFLLLLPEHLIDYVILHELCHTKELNHSVNFWKLMDEVTANKAKKLRAEMKKFNIPS